MQGMFARALFLSASELMPEDSFSEAKEKYMALNQLFSTCVQYMIILSEEDRETHMRL